MSHVDEGTLHTYLDGELPSTEGAALEAHLAQCDACRARLVDERALRDRSAALLGSARPVERPLPPFEQMRRAPKRSPWRVRTPFAWAASIALALGIGYYLSETSYRMSYETAPPLPTPRPATVVAQQREKQDVATAPAPVPRAPAERRGSTPRDQARRETAERDQQKPSNQAAASSLGRVDSGTLKIVQRGAAPATAPGAVAAASAAPASADEQVLSERKVSSNTWPRIDRETAKAILGEDPVGLPDLMTRDYRRSPDRDGVVMVEQLLDDRTVIQIFQQQTARANARFDSLVTGTRGARLYDADRQRADRLARFVGKLRVEIGGPVSVDSLNRLLEQVGRLP